MSPSVEPFDEAKYKALMDGLECIEVSLSAVKENKDFRIDSAFYTSSTRKNPTLSYGKIGDYLIESQYGISKDMNLDGIGYPIYRMDEIHDMLCDLATEKYVGIDAATADKYLLKDGDVLFNRTNSYEFVGRTGIYYYTGTPQVFASYLVRFIPNQEYIFPEYLAAFLSTKYGVSEIKRRARQSINQTNVNPEEVKEIQIPLLTKGLQRKIRKVFHRAHQSRLSAQSVYMEADRTLQSVFPLDGVAFSEKAYTTKTLKESFSISGRLDAEYYQPKYDAYVRALHTFDTVNSLCVIHDRNYRPKENEPYKYIELANVGNSGDISNVEIINGSELPSRARRIVKEGQVIVSSVEGSLQSCALITDELDGALCSTGFYVLTSDSINSETLLLLFKSKIMQALLKQRCSGTILAAVTKDELLSMPLPSIDSNIQAEIARKIQISFSLRRQSTQLLEYAKRAVEMAIEQGEDAALTWLTEKTGE